MDAGILSLISSGRLRQALETLESMQPNLPGLEALRDAYNELQLAHLQERVSWEQYKQNREELAGRISALAEQLNSPGGGAVSAVPVIPLPILAVTFADRLVEQWEDLFKKFSFTGGKACTWEKRLAFDPYRIILFDNTDLMGEREAEESFLKMDQRKKRQERELQMEYCLSNSTAYLLHYGNYLSWLEAHRARAHAANSKFALYARLKELVDFIKAIEA